MKEQTMRRIPLGTVVHNQVSGKAFRLEAFLGQGGFGAAYSAVKLGRGGKGVGDPVCLKFTSDANAWHGEAFFAGLLKDQRNVVKQFDAFPTTVVEGTRQRMVFVIEMELVATGTVADACADGRLPWSEERVVRKVRGLLKPLSLLHNTGSSHRDVTPGNVYVAHRAALKLGDFGIAKTGLIKSGVRADAYNPHFVPPDLGAFWRPADDVYQVGLLMLTLLFGQEVGNDVRKPEVNQVTSRDYGLRDAVKGAISVKSRRPQTAEDLLRTLPSR